MAVDSSRPIPIICGPTGSGKTAVALELADRYPIEIVSADSRQVIKHLNIGTAKPTVDQRRRVQFHLLDIIEPGERYSVRRFIDEAGQTIQDILGRGRIPVVVGGTGLYLRALSEGVVEVDEDGMGLRERLQREMDELGPEVMHERLHKIDPQEAARIHPNNRVRIVRALEIFFLTGRTKSELVATGAYKKSDFSFEYRCLAPPREQLYGRINDRVDQMMADGLLEELQELIARGMKEGIRKAGVIGYSELLDHLDGRWTLPEAVALVKQNSRRYAKRQMTWFRHQAKTSFFPDGSSLTRDLCLG